MMNTCEMLIRSNAAILIFSLLQTTVSSSCNEADDISPCTCYDADNEIKVDCSGYGLQSLPDNLPEGTSVLDFSNNLLQPGSVKPICEYNSLEHVSIAGNRLTHLKPRSLQRCGSVKSFNFSGNVFDRVTKYTLYGLEFTPSIYGLEARFFKEDTLADMVSLEELGIVTYQNTLPAHLFKDKRKLKRLTIGIHGATSIPEILFDPLASQLTQLTLKSTSLQRVPKMLLSNSKALKICNFHITDLHNIPSTLFQNDALYHTLEKISLSGIKSLPLHIFRKLVRLRHLEIHRSDDMPSGLFQGLLTLETLDLSASSVPVIPDGWFTDLRSLKELNLHDVGLTIVKKEDFYNLGSLEKLDLSKNDLRNLNSESFHEISASVKFIDISENILKKVPSNLFKEKAALECLDISGNQIYSIENEAFYHLPELKRLYLQNNKLYDLKAATFIYNVNMGYLDMSSNILIDLPVELFGGMHSLVVLNLSNNRIYNLERSIKFNIPSLREINLSYNPFECNCGTLAVKELLSKVSIIGDCEKPQPGIAIVDFVPDTNCILKSETDLFGIKNTSSTDFLYPAVSKTDVGESDTLTITYDTGLKSVNASKSFATTTGNVVYTSRKLSDSWMNDFTISDHLSKEISDLTASKVNPSEFNGVETASTSRDVSVSIISKSTSVKGDISKVYSSFQTTDFSIHKLNSSKVHKTQTAGDDIKSHLSYFTKPTVGVYNTIKTVLSREEKFGTVKPEQHSTLFTLGEGTSYLTVEPTAALEPSFKTTYDTSYLASVVIVTGSVQPTPVSLVLTSDVSQPSGYLNSILPSSVTVITEGEDDHKMTDWFHNLNETTGTSLNVTKLPPSFELGVYNETNESEMAEKNKRSDYFYLSLASILSVAIFSLLILVFLYYKKRRNTQYELQSRPDVDVYNLDHSFQEDGRVTPNSALCPAKSVPSIQIESVDDDGNVKVEMYPISKT